MRIKTVLIVTTIGLSVCLAASIQEKQEDGDFDKRDRSAKSLGLHTSIDGTSFAWVNTSAVSTAGFFGNAAVLLAGVYLLSHSDKIPELADGVNSLLSPNENLVNYEEADQNLLQKGKDILGDTLDTINKNVKSFKSRVNKKSSGLLHKLSQLDNPIKRLKDKLLPEPKVTIDAPAPVSQALSPGRPQIFSIENSAVFDDDFFTEPKFNFGKRTSHNKDSEQLILVIPDSISEKDELPFLQSNDYDGDTVEDDEDVVNILEESELEMEDIEDKEKMKKIEKKREWAESFLKSYYKLQELKKKRKEKEKERSKLERLTTDDMKPFVNIQTSDEDGDMLKIEKKEINDEGHQIFINLGASGDFFKTGSKQREMESKLSEFQTQKGLRIDDEEVQSIIDSQLQNFESFKIQKFVDVEEPENEPEPDSELNNLRRQALNVIEIRRRKNGDDVDEEELDAEESIIEATTMAFKKDTETDTEDDIKIETSTGNDILIDNFKKRRNKH